MNGKALLILGISLFGFQSPGSEKVIQNLTCELRNFFGLRIGSVTTTPKEALQISNGFLSGQLDVDEVTRNEVIAIDRYVDYSYIFASNEALTKKHQSFEGLLYQQAMKELGGSRLPVAQFRCELTLK